MNYFVINEDEKVIFNFIRRFLDESGNPVSTYEQEEKGIRNFQGILMRTQNDEFYPTVFEKAAYLFCGLIEGHYFSNGNKRLALMSTVFFLGLNNYNTRNVSRNAGITLLKKSFPNAILSQVSDIPEVVPELSYHLCKIVADSPTHQMDFDTLKRTVERILQFLFIEK